MQKTHTASKAMLLLTVQLRTHWWVGVSNPVMDGSGPDPSSYAKMKPNAREGLTSKPSLRRTEQTL